MNGVHDMGGMDGFGPVRPQRDEPVFHAAWEGRVLAMSRALGAAGAWNIDQGRFGIELLPPDLYLASSYYQRWFLRLERMLVERGLVDADELKAGRALRAGPGLPRAPLAADEVRAGLRRGDFARPAAAPARFLVGQRVRARNIHPAGHTRLPRYVRGHAGVVERLHGAHAFPDRAAQGQDGQGEWLYTVCFSGRDLWGDQADPTLSVSVEAFEPYLEPA